LVVTVRRRRRAFCRRGRLRALKRSGVDALARIGGPLATTALDEAAKTGDRMLKKIVSRTASPGQ